MQGNQPLGVGNKLVVGFSRLLRIYLIRKGAKLQDVLVPIALSVIESMFKGLKNSDLESLKQTMDHFFV